MSRAMELTVYPIWDDGFGRLYADKGDRTRPTSVGYMQVVKRLTEPELAAEYQRMSHEFDIAKYGLECDPYPGRTADFDEAGDRAEILQRFATTPHYFEQAA